jgi:hypothetical protein
MPEVDLYTLEVCCCWEVLRSDQEPPFCQTAEQDVDCHDIDLWKLAQVILQTNLMQSSIYEVLWKKKHARHMECTIRQ